MKQRHLTPPMPLAALKGGESNNVSAPERVFIPLGQLRASPYNVRKHRSPSRIREIADSLTEHGQREPITVYPGTLDGEKVYFIVSGVTRHTAAIMLGWTQLECRVDERLTSADSLTIISTSRVHNDSLPESDLDIADSFVQLTQEKNYTQAQIAKALGYGSDRRVRALKAIIELPPAVREVANDFPHLFTATFAEQLKAASKILIEEEMAGLLRRFLTNDDPTEITRTTLASLIRTEELKKSRAARKEGAKQAGKGTQLRARLLSTDDVKIHGEKVGDLRVLKESETLRRIEFGVAVPSEIAEQIRALPAEVVKKIAEAK